MYSSFCRTKSNSQRNMYLYEYKPEDSFWMLLQPMSISHYSILRHPNEIGTFIPIEWSAHLVCLPGHDTTSSSPRDQLMRDERQNDAPPSTSFSTAAAAVRRPHARHVGKWNSMAREMELFSHCRSDPNRPNSALSLRYSRRRGRDATDRTSGSERSELIRTSSLFKTI